MWLTKFVLGAMAIWFRLVRRDAFWFFAVERRETLELIEAQAFRGFYLDCHSPRKRRMCGQRKRSATNGERRILYG
jgi:hypothetical protein